LSGDGDRAQVIEERQFGVVQEEFGTQDERNQQNEYNQRHAMRSPTPADRSKHGCVSMAASMQKAMLKSPVFGEVHL
jgi:hypothetical protein